MLDLVFEYCLIKVYIDDCKKYKMKWVYRLYVDVKLLFI